jgi:hypothetical protein
MPLARKSTIILVLVFAAALLALTPDQTIADSRGDRIGKLHCASGEIAKFDGSKWICAPDDNTDTLDGLSCNDGEIAKFDGSVWKCSPDHDTLAGLSCEDGQVAQFNNTTGKWECATINDGGGPASCPDGFVALNNKVCIEVFNRDTEYTWFDANSACIDADYRLCTTGEWAAACENGIITITSKGEWLDDNVYFGNFMTIIGYGDCRNMAFGQPDLPEATFRCCMDR